MRDLTGSAWIVQAQTTPDRIRVPRNGSVGLPPTVPKPKLLDQVRQAIRARHYSLRTEEAYVAWIK